MDGIGQVRFEAAEDAVAEGGQRARKRDSMFLSALLSIGDSRTVYEVRVRNLSEGGLMAELDRPVEPGTVVHMEMRGLGEMTGRVAWCTRGRLGIALDHPIDPARARKPVGAGAQANVRVKPLVVPARRR